MPFHKKKSKSRQRDGCGGSVSENLHFPWANRGESLDIAIDANCARRDASPFITFMATVEGLNQREVLGIPKTLEAVGSLGITSTDPLWLALSQYIGRTGGRHCTPQYLALLKQKADAALCRGPMASSEGKRHRAHHVCAELHGHNGTLGQSC